MEVLSKVYIIVILRSKKIIDSLGMEEDMSARHVLFFLFVFGNKSADQKEMILPIGECPTVKRMNAQSDAYERTNSSRVFVNSSV